MPLVVSYVDTPFEVLKVHRLGTAVIVLISSD